MKICSDHWNMIRSSVISHGLDHLGAKSGEQAIQDIKKELDGTTTTDDFDPNMSHHWHWTNNAISNGGLYLMGQNKDGSNDGQYCPVCELAKHYKDFVPQTEIDKVSSQMLSFCKEKGLV